LFLGIPDQFDFWGGFGTDLGYCWGKYGTFCRFKGYPAKQGILGDSEGRVWDVSQRDIWFWRGLGKLIGNSKGSVWESPKPFSKGVGLGLPSAFWEADGSQWLIAWGTRQIGPIFFM